MNLKFVSVLYCKEKGERVTQSLFSVEQARAGAEQRLPKMIFDFIDGASGDESCCVEQLIPE